MRWYAAWSYKKQVFLIQAEKKSLLQRGTLWSYHNPSGVKSKSKEGLSLGRDYKQISKQKALILFIENGFSNDGNQKVYY